MTEHGDDPFTDSEEREMKRIAKEAFKEAQKEWMDEKLKEFGKWSLMTLGAALIIALLYFLLQMNGWKAPTS